jgi:hypothetical protein
MTISCDDIAIGNVVFSIVETLCYRKCVRGRSTRVCVLEPKAHISPNTISTMNTSETIVVMVSPPILRRSGWLKKKEDEKVKAAANTPQMVCYCSVYLSNLLSKSLSDSSKPRCRRRHILFRVSQWRTKDVY